MSFDPIVNGALAFLAVLILMALNIPIGISMLIVGFTGFGFIVGFEQAFFVCLQTQKHKGPVNQ